MRRLNGSCGMIAAAAAAFLCASSAHGDGFSGSGSKGHVSAAPNATADNYVVDDGGADDDIGINGGGSFDLIWLNSFARQSGHERINQISVAYGSPFDPRSYNGLPVKILLYGDTTGGSPTDAFLLYTFNTTIANSNTDTFQSYAVPNIPVPSTFLVGVVAKNMAANNTYLAGIDYTSPTLSDTSYGGYTLAGNTLNEANLGSVPNFSTMEGFGFAGNWLVRANGVAVPEPASMAVGGAGLGLTLLRRR